MKGLIETASDKVIEECSELILALSKAKRFGWGNSHPRKTQNNKELVEHEMVDVKTAINKLNNSMKVFL